MFKTKCIRTTVFHSGPDRVLADVEFATASWVDWYNNRRLHGTLGMLTPVVRGAPLRGPHPRAKLAK
ncbi:transposase [Cellulosimicrobium funkei]|nr:transposase [Cellulosimicrobium funkei]